MLKKILSMGLVLCLLLSLPLFAAGESEDGYENPHNIIIQTPKQPYTTTAKQVSIYGACDYDYPLYMNGKLVNTTERGFFAQYVSLNMGSNQFVFTNNGKTKTVTITRKTGSSAGSGQTKINIWGQGVTPKYAVVEGHNISRMASPGTDGQKLLMPLAKGTVAQITGDAGNLYRLSDGTFIYKSNVKVTNGTLPKSVISGAQLTPITDKSCTELKLPISQNALYNLEMLSGRAVLTVYNTKLAAPMPEIAPNKILKSITVMSDGSSSGNTNTVLSFNFREGAPVAGYYAEFAGGVMTVGFKHRPVINGSDLTGVRIHIDAGHGGSDTGSLGAASTYGPVEKQINLSIALGIRDYLESRGATVLMTRTDDTAMALPDRAYLVAMEKPDLCLSVHCNSMGETANYNAIKGLLTFYSLDHSSDANIINEGIAQNMGIESKTARHSNLAMTRMTGYPSVLFEAGFMSNPSNYEWLIKKSTQQKFGVAAGKAVETYINRVGVLRDVTVTLNGQPVDTGDQPPILKDSRTLVPLRAIFEALGASVNWDADTETVTAEKDGTKIVLQIGSRNMSVTKEGVEQSVTLEVPAQVTNGRTLVPVRAVAEAMDASVDWNAPERNVLITVK